MWKASFTSLWARRARLVMSLVAIVLGVAFVSGSFVFSDMMKSSLANAFESSIADVDVSKSLETEVDRAGVLDQQVIDRIAAVDGVAQARGTVTEYGVIPIDAKGKAVSTLGPPQVGADYHELAAFGGRRGAYVVEGHAPTADDEVALDPDTLRKTGLAIGDRIKVITPAKGTREFTLSGSATTGSGSTAGATYAFFTTKTAQQLFTDAKPVFTNAWIVADAGVDPVELAQRVQRVLPAGYQAKDGAALSGELASEMKEGLKFVDLFLMVFAGIALLVASFLIVNTFTILVAQRSKELALYRAMGASRGQIRHTVIAEALLLGVVGSLLGLVLGLALAMAIKAAVAPIWDLGQTQLALTPTGVIASLAVGILVTLLAAAMPAHRATKVAPIQAMTAARTETDQGLGRRATIGVVLAVAGALALALGALADVPLPAAWTGAGIALALVGVAIASPLLGRPVVWLVGKLYSAVFGELGRLAAINSVRQPRRTAATAAALMVGLSLVSMMAVFGKSANVSVTNQVADTVRGDFMVGRAGFQGFPTEVANKVRKVEQVGSVHAMKAASLVDLEGRTPAEALKNPAQAKWKMVAGMQASDLDQIFPQKITQGRMFERDAEMIVEAETATKDGVKVGDAQEFFSPVAQRMMKFTVVGIYDKGKGQAIGDRWVPTSTLAAAGLDKQDTFLSIHLKPGADKAAARTALDAATADMPLVNVMDLGEYTEVILSQVNKSIGLLYALLALSVVIAVLGIVNTLGLSIIERTREIGLLRSIALTRGQVRRMITLESVVIALLGAVVGVGLGTGFGVALRRVLVDQGIDQLAIPWGQLAAFVGAAVVVGVLAALWPAHRAARTNILKAIAAE